VFFEGCPDSMLVQLFILALVGPSSNCQGERLLLFRRRSAMPAAISSDTSNMATTNDPFYLRY